MRIWQVLMISIVSVSAFIFPYTADAAKNASKHRHTNASLAHKHVKKLVLGSSSAIILVQGTDQVLYEKNAGDKKAIASITKLMTAMVVLDSHQSLDTPITICSDDVDRQRWSKSKLPVGVTLTRHEMLKLALMASENRAAFALARSYQGGTNSFVEAMNRAATRLGMKNTVFYGPTGLDARNVSTARDIAIMVNAAYRYKLIRQMTTSVSHRVNDKTQEITFRNTNRLVKRKGWKIGLSKTGYISNSGKCLVMQATIGNQPTIIILLDSWGVRSRIVDAVKVKRWIELGNGRKSIRG
ncbi:D-alanyl-D-alanine endopeptidase precursor [mine drainage metagenome]|uniref:D-alanyl-D-alanine endopeptidase n=1 Tax=mine drainage metagenome TaxID=410659 RepID=A0A1J5RMC4_9ZZZZ